ncbi:BglG family transcription antiterminator [Thermicanus aegyptius]|uniref:BglG family transcription antiterminator n=1 Tax=Thermicanus aegyptius TaxID=94009 RepID=UPI00040E1260|nr:BglG family transcription antiterminator [Thermicanus aegyptius]
MIYQDNRKRKLLDLLLRTEEFYPVAFFAEKLNVSEKTVRNDLKALESLFRKIPGSEFIKKPNRGILLKIPEENKDRLMTELRNSDFQAMDADGRKVYLLYLLLFEERIYTLQELADRFYTSKSTIHHNLREIDKWLNKFDLRLIKRTNYGIKVEGNEKDWRRSMYEVIESLLANPNRSVHYKWFGPIRDEIQFIKRILINISKDFHIPFAEVGIENLAIETYLMVKRVKEQKRIHLCSRDIIPLNSDWVYPIAQKLIDVLSTNYAIRFPKSEIDYLTCLILGTKLHLSEDFYTANMLNKVVPSQIASYSKALIEKVERFTHIQFVQDEMLQSGLTLHLFTAYHRLKFKLPIVNPMLEEIKQTYRYIFEAVFAAIPEMEEEAGVTISEDEVGYIVLHFQASLERRKVESPKKRALVVCAHGIGSAQLLISKLRKSFPGIDILNAISVSSLTPMLEKERVDFIVSTVPLKDQKVPVVQVSPLLSPKEYEAIDRIVNGLNENRRVGKYPVFKEFLLQGIIKVGVQADTPEEVIRFLVQQLESIGAVSPRYLKSVLERERSSATAIGGGLAIPHGSPMEIITPMVALAKLSHPILWGREKVSLVLMLAITLEEQKKTQLLFEEIIHLIEDVDTLDCLRKSDEEEIFLNCL